MLSSANVLVHYDPTLPIHLAGDADAYRMGTVISHVYPDGLNAQLLMLLEHFQLVRKISTSGERSIVFNFWGY